MKRFLKKANRGLLLGALALFALVIYVMVDYANFGEEKSQIKTTIENYITDFCELMEKNDLDGINKLIGESWTDELVSTSPFEWYQTKNDILDNVETAQADVMKPKYGDVKAVINSISIKKCGPNMAYVTAKYSVTAEYVSYGEPIDPFFEYYSNWYDPVYNTEDELRIINNMGYDCDMYVYKEDGEWKISQSTSYITSQSQSTKEVE